MTLPPCTHRLVVEDEDWEHVGEGSGPAYPLAWRVCLLCGVAYNRTAVLLRLEAAIRARWRMPPSPWSAEERARDTD